MFDIEWDAEPAYKVILWNGFYLYDHRGFSDPEDIVIAEDLPEEVADRMATELNHLTLSPVPAEALGVSPTKQIIPEKDTTNNI